MKTPFPKLLLTFLFLLLGLLSSCSNMGEKRSLLASAGFKTLPATTPTQEARLHSLTPGKITPFTGKNGKVYLFADPSKNSVMIGGPRQFLKYQALKARQRKIDENLLDAQVNMDNADYSAWGPDSSWGFGVASDPM